MAFVGIPKETKVYIKRMDDSEVEGIVRYTTNHGLMLYGEEDNESILIPWHTIYQVKSVTENIATTFDPSEKL